MPRRGLIPILLLLALAAGCTEVRLISPYDEATDRGTTELHRKLETLLVALETAEAEERTFIFNRLYPEVLVDLRALRIRAGARPQNELQMQQFDELERQLTLFGDAYREGMAPDEIDLFRTGFDRTLRAILTLELAKKRNQT